jgi:hypothetical protein
MVPDNPILEARGREADFRKALSMAVRAGADGENDLVSALLQLEGDEEVNAVAALGDASGPLGIPALRRLLATPAAANAPTYPALMAIAKREGTAASDVLVDWLRKGNDNEKAAAMIGLAAVGDDRAWDLAFERLTQLLREKRTTQFGPPMRALPSNSRPAMAISYLARHVSSNHQGRLSKLVNLLRQNWHNLNPTERTWLMQRWPSVAPETVDVAHVEPPDGKYLALWASTPMLDPIYR